MGGGAVMGGGSAARASLTRLSFSRWRRRLVRLHAQSIVDAELGGRSIAFGAHQGRRTGAVNVNRTGGGRSREISGLDSGAVNVNSARGLWRRWAARGRAAILWAAARK